VTQLSRVLDRLAEVCAEYRWQEKLLLAPTRSQGHMLLEALAKRGGTWLNLRPVTITELAFTAAETDMRQRQLKLLDSVEQVRLVGQVLDRLHANRELKYFLELHQLGVLEPHLVRTINELRLAGVSAKMLAGWAGGAKGQELALILTDYEGALEKQNWVDLAGLYQRAATQIAQGATNWQQRILLMPDQLELPLLARNMLEALHSASCIYLPQEKVVGMVAPAQWGLGQGEGGGNGFERLYTDAHQLVDLTVEVIPAYGRTNELRNVLRQIMTAGMPLDTVLLAYTDTAAYNRLTHTITQAYGIPATFAAGIPIDTTTPGKLLLLLLKWLETDYSADIFYRLLVDGYLNFDFDTTTGRIWRDAGSIWGREHYLPGLKRYLEQLKQQAVTNLQAQQDMASAQVLLDFCTSLLTTFGQPETQDGVDFSALCAGLAACLQLYAGQENENDRVAMEVLPSLLEQYQNYYDQPVSLAKSLRLLRQVLDTQSVAASGPRPGHLHICHYREGEWCARPHTFIMGLDADTFPGVGHQDPIMLDEERKTLSDRLTIKARETTDNIYRLTRFLATRQGHLVLSFSCFDPTRFRTLLPSSLILQVYRLLSGQMEANYSQLQNVLPTPANFLPSNLDQALTDSDWWGHGFLAAKHEIEWPVEMDDCYPLTVQGRQAEAMRTSGGFTPYDGHIEDENMRLDLRELAKPTSASSLEAAAKCPFAYFLRYILGITPPPAAMGDTEGWLDPLQRGTLLHDIYCSFGRQQVACSSSAAELLLTLTRETIDAWRDIVPVHNEQLFQQARDEIIEGLPVFLGLYYQDGDGYEPAFFEVPFGFGEQAVQTAGTGLAAPLKIQLPGNKAVYLRGRIDRLDRSPSGDSYRVWDYKTGGHSHYMDRANVKQGRQLQPLLYTLAAQAILDQGLAPVARVDASGYLFPTRRGEGHMIARSAEANTRGIAALDCLLDLLAKGSFSCRHNNEECLFCDYRIVCRFPLGCQRMALKMESDQSGLLQAWKGLQEYE